MNESELIINAQRGDQTAWHTLVTEHRQAIFRLCYLLLHDSDEAEDATQETFIRAFRARSRIDAARPLRPWLLQIATNVTRNRQRSLRRYLAAVRRTWSEPPFDQASSEHTSVQWEADQLWQAIRRLGRSDQEVLYLRYFLEQSEREISATLGIAGGTVKSRLHRATARLRAIIANDFPLLSEERHV